MLNDGSVCTTFKRYFDRDDISRWQERHGVRVRVEYFGAGCLLCQARFGLRLPMIRTDNETRSDSFAVSDRSRQTLTPCDRWGSRANLSLRLRKPVRPPQGSHPSFGED